jgi:hypothetical protein
MSFLQLKPWSKLIIKSKKTFTNISEPINIIDEDTTYLLHIYGKLVRVSLDNKKIYDVDCKYLLGEIGYDTQITWTEKAFEV